VSGNDYLDFSRTSSRYIDGGERTFNIGTTGFTMVAVVMFSGTAAAGSYETFFDLGSGDIDNNINILWDSASTGAFAGILNSNVGACNAVLGSSITGTWQTFTMQYMPNTKTTTMNIDSSTNSAVCAVAQTDRTTLVTYVGIKSFTGVQYFQSRIAGFYAVDAVLSAGEIVALDAGMRSGADLQGKCAACPLGLDSQGVAVGEEACYCTPGTFRSGPSSRAADCRRNSRRWGRAGLRQRRRWPPS